MEYLFYISFAVFVYILYSQYRLRRKWKKTLKGKVVLITGSANGLGRALCLAFAREQCHLICVDFNEESNAETVEKIKEIVRDSVKVHAYTVDLTNKDQIYELKDKILEKYENGIDILVNNAGVMWPCRLLDLSDKQIQRLVDTNLVSHFWLIRSFLPKMIEKNSGHIVTIASIMIHIPLEAFAPYRATKYGVTGLIESLTYELQAMKSKVKTLLVYPSFMNTEMIPKKLYKAGSGITMVNNLPIEIVTTKDVAENIIKAIKADQRKIYIPYYHYLVLLLFRILPQFLQDLIINHIASVQNIIDPLEKME